MRLGKGVCLVGWSLLAALGCSADGDADGARGGGRGDGDGSGLGGGGAFNADGNGGSHPFTVPMDLTDGEVELTGSFIWIANTQEGTVSKIDTETMMEEGRYLTSPSSTPAVRPGRRARRAHRSATTDA